MGLFDSIINYFQQQGGQVVSNVTAPYSGGGPSVPGNSPSVPTQSAPPPQPIQINPMGAITTWGTNTYNFVSSGIQNVSSGIQNFVAPIQSPSVTNPVQQIQMSIINPVQTFINPSYTPTPVIASPTGMGGGAAYMPTQVMNQTPPGMTLYVPYGNQAQTQVNNLTSVVYDPVGGGFAGYVVPYGHSITNIVTSGSSGSLQSGMFSTAPLTPVVYTQESAGKVFASTAVPAAAALVLASPSSYSRLGAEAYGGYVQPLDNRVLSPTTPVSVYPSGSGNLASLVNPTGINQPKQNWAEMPWNISPTQTGLYSITPTGMMTPVSQQGLASIGMAPPVMMASISGAVLPPAARQERNWLDQMNYDIGGFMGIRASGLEQTASGYGEATAKRPFISAYAGDVGTVFEAPRGDIFGFVVPGISPVIAYFQQGKEITTSSMSSELPNVTTLKGTTTENIQGGTLTTQYFETTGGKQVTKTTTATPTPSGFEQFQTGISDWMYSGLGSAFGVSKEQAKTSLSISGNISREMANYAPATNLPTAVGVAEIQKGFNEPVLAAVNVGIGVAFGAGFKALEGVYGVSRAATAEKVISQGGVWRGAEIATSFAMEKAPLVLGGLYGFSIVARSTEGFQDFQPGNVATRAAPILTYETIPMSVGFGLPGQAITAARMSDIGYKSAVQEGYATGRLDYYVRQPGTRPYEMAKIDYASYMQEGGTGVAGYAGYKVESAYRLNVDIPIKTFIQEGFNRPVPEPAAPSPISTPTPSTGTQLPTRMGTKIVGGREVSSLAPERSLQSMGATGKQTPDVSGKGFTSSRTTDFRGKPVSSTMKPMTEDSLGYQGTKQATGQMVLSEQLPKIEGMTEGRVIPQQQTAPRSMFATQFAAPISTNGIVQVIEPELLFSQSSELMQQQMTKQEPMLGRISFATQVPASATATMTEVLSGQRQEQILAQFSMVSQRSATQTQQAVRSTVSSRDVLYSLDVARVSDILPVSRTRQDQFTTPYSDVRLASDIIPRFDQIITPRVDQRITTDYKPYYWQIPTITPTTTPFPGFFPGVPGSGGGGGSRKRRGAFTEIFNMGLDYSLRQRSKRQGKSWAQPKKVREARAAAKKGGKKK